jgi:hypothetical protein
MSPKKSFEHFSTQTEARKVKAKDGIVLERICEQANGTADIICRQQIYDQLAHRLPLRQHNGRKDQAPGDFFAPQQMIGPKGRNGPKATDLSWSRHVSFPPKSDQIAAPH